jgi:hypothetical protein
VGRLGPKIKKKPAGGGVERARRRGGRGGIRPHHPNGVKVCSLHLGFSNSKITSMFHSNFIKLLYIKKIFELLIR